MNVKEYAREKGVSVQSVYGRIKRGTLQTHIVNGATHVVEPNDLLNPLNGTMNHDCIEELKKVSKKLDKEHRKRLKAIHRLELAEMQLKSMETMLEVKDKQIATLERSLDSYERLFGKGLLSHNEVVEVVAEEVPSKKSKKKRKKKK